MTRVLMAEATDFRGTTQVGSHAIARQFAQHGADVVELVDALASGASEGNLVGVRVPPSALITSSD